MSADEVILIQPPQPKSLRKEYISVQVPVNLGYIASSLVSEGARVTIKDFVVERYQRDSFLAEIRRRQPLFVGFTSMTSSLPFVHFISRHIKTLNAGIMTVLGGVHASALPLKTLLELSHIDFIVVGEGEITIRELYNEMRGTQDYRSVKGIAFRDKVAAEPCMTPRRSLIENLDDVIFPAFELFKTEQYRNAHVSRGFSREQLAIMELLTSRGCPQNCIFCAGHINYGNSVRFRSAENIIKEIETYSRIRRVEHISIEDDVFTLNKALVKELGVYLRHKNITWNCNARVDSVNQDIAFGMVQDNCRKVSFGIESGSDRILRLSKKNITISQIKDAFRAFRKAGIRHIEGNFMLGSHMDETIDDIKMTEDLIFTLQPDFITLTVMCPFPGTEAYAIMEKEGLLPRQKNWLNFNLVTEKLPYKKLHHISSEELLQWRNYLLKKYYTSSAYILRQLFAIRNLKELRYLLRLAMAVHRDSEKNTIR
jgi:radical SAM superfamily enzyme YgiQ (UPF0313 family)